MARGIHVVKNSKLSFDGKNPANQDMSGSSPNDKHDSIGVEQMALLQRRLKECHIDPTTVLTWDETKKRIIPSKVNFKS